MGVAKGKERRMPTKGPGGEEWREKVKVRGEG